MWGCAYANSSDSRLRARDVVQRAPAVRGAARVVTPAVDVVAHILPPQTVSQGQSLEFIKLWWEVRVHVHYSSEIVRSK